MATNPKPDIMNEAPVPNAAPAVLVCLPPMSHEAQDMAIAHLGSAFPGEAITLAGASETVGHLRAVDYKQPRSRLGWVLAAADYAAASQIAQQEGAQAILVLGPDASTLPAETLRVLVETVRSGADLAVPRYPVGPRDALIASSMLYPLTRALFSADVRFPLPADAALSPRMLQRLTALAVRANASGAETLLWPVAEAIVAGYSVRQIDTAERILTAPTDVDLNTLLASVVGGIFADIEVKAAFWQRGRNLAPVYPSPLAIPPEQLGSTEVAEETRSMIDGFRLASANLTEIWSLILSPQSLVALRKLSRVPYEEFTLDSALWARIVYDFVLAFHLRTMNRNHLLGAMTPLYLAWVASHILAAGGDSARAARLIETAAHTFESEKPYLVSRWRWPDRFNP